jgi:hypothetical protein
VSASAGYVALVRGVLAHTHGMALDASEAAYLGRCEAAELSPRIVANVIAMHARMIARVNARQSHTSNRQTP